MPPVLQPTMYAVTRRLIYDRSARIGVVGLGYEGLRLAFLFSRANFVVQGFDPDARKVTTLETGQSYLHQISARQISEVRDRGFRVGVDFSQLRETDVILTCLPASLDQDGKPDLTSIREITFAIASHLHAGHLVIFENAIYPGVTEEIVVPILEGANGMHLRVSRDTGAPNELFVGVSIGRADLETSAVDQCDELKILAGTDQFATNLMVALYRTVFTDIVSVSTTPKAGRTGAVLH
jgi:UDP-N-acetyl-D-glucosamine dehydrogenase